MKRAVPANPAAASQQTVTPSAESAQLALREAAVLMTPVVRWLVRSGVSYPVFTEMLKAVFVEAARGELEGGAATPTQSALSMLSGVHRKDVRTLAESPSVPHGVPRPSLPSQVVTRWLSDPQYRDADGKPRALPRTGGERSFESLCRSLSSDVHPRTVLDELMRLGLAALDGTRVKLLADAFVPAAQLDELSALFSANVADHIAAGVDNMTLNAPKLLEQSIFADGLTPASIELLHRAAREAWLRTFDKVVRQAQRRVDHDADADGHMRMRFGVYFYAEPTAAAPATATPSETHQPKRRARPRSRP